MTRTSFPLGRSRLLGATQLMLRDIGISLKRTGEGDELMIDYRVGGTGAEGTAYFTDDLEDALQTGRRMAEERAQAGGSAGPATSPEDDQRLVLSPGQDAEGALADIERSERNGLRLRRGHRFAQTD